MIFQSPYPQITIPEMSLTEFVFQKAKRLSTKPAIIDAVSGRQYTYAELVDGIRRVAAGLTRRGFQKGDVLAILSPNLPEYAIAFHAAAVLGGAVTTVNPLYTSEEIANQLRDSEAQLLITVPQLMDRAREASAKSAVREIFVFGETEGATPFEHLMAEEGNVPLVPIRPDEDLVALPYSSGTTGLAKGVMLTHSNLIANMLQLDAVGHTHESDTLICFLPMFHIYGMVVILNLGLYVGATIVTMPRFDLEQTLRVIRDYRVTFVHLVPPIVLALVKSTSRIEEYFSSLRGFFSGAAPLDKDLTLACMQRFGCSLRQGYGMTESSPAILGSPLERYKEGSAGVILPNTECKIVDVSGETDLGCNQPGEIWMRGPQKMKGYLNRPDATASTITPDGWLRTGDIGYVDEDGHFFVVDRLKELIKYKGFQVPPAELEAVLLSHPAVSDAAVIPTADPEAGEIPKAFIVRKDPSANMDEILTFVAERVAPHKKIRKAEFIDSIPKSPSGKILRRILIERERRD